MADGHISHTTRFYEVFTQSGHLSQIEVNNLTEGLYVACRGYRSDCQKLVATLPDLGSALGHANSGVAHGSMVSRKASDRWEAEA